MASRMTISSLLCDEQPAPVPHSQTHSQTLTQSQPQPHSHSHSHPHSRSPVLLAPHLRSQTHGAPPFHIPTSSPFIGLEALVHAATEERRRLSGGSSSTVTTDSSPPPSFHRHQDYIRSPNLQPRHRHRLVLDEPPPPHRDELSHRPTPGYFPLPPRHQSDIQHQRHQQIQIHHQHHQHQIQRITHVPSMPLQLEIPLHHTFSRSSDSDHPNQFTAVDDPPTKKRRYSDSPDRTFTIVDPPILHSVPSPPPPPPPPPAISPRRPGSGAGRKQINLADLITSDRPPSDLTRELHPTLSPLGRRSPPGSLSGRAKAARKSEEGTESVKDPVRQPSPQEEQPKRPREDRKKSRSQPVSDQQQQQPPKIKDPIHRPLPPPPPPPKAPEEDAHEWFLEHYDEYSATDALPPAHSSPVAPVPVPPPPSSPAPTKKPTPSPTTMPDAASALEQELEALMAEVPDVVSKVEPDIDMDVDLAVTELVAETLDAQPTKREDVGMEVDDELLSLVDDRPPPRRSSSGGNPTKPPSLRAVGESDPRPTSPPAAASPSAFLSPAVRPSSTRPTSERGSMPPPASVAPGRAKDKGDRAGSVSATAAKKKPAKPPPKPKTAPVVPAAKPRVKAGPKSKPRGADNPTVVPTKSTKPAAATVSKKTTTTTTTTTTASRSRSASAMPGGSAGPETEKQEEEEEEEQHEDDKLYCVCKTKYDEDRFMIACDRCDEWYHTHCVSMLDLEVDLVDQFVCPPCVEKNPHLPLRTTYKQRCLYGLKHADPESPKACHKPARGAFSKYCSDECGVKYMQTRIDAWAKKGGKKDKLWESVKNAEKREGVVVIANGAVVSDVTADDQCKKEDQKPFLNGKLKKSKVEREVERLNSLLDQVVKLREEVKKGMEVVVWREKLLELATERAEQVGQCGWDQRLCFGDEEWSDFGAGVLESYEEAKAEGGSSQGDMQVDGSAEDDGEWWCPGKSMCDRHNGWQAVRHRDVCKEKEKKEDALLNLTTREREIRKRIEDIIDPHGHNCNEIVTKSPLKSSNTKLTNGHTKGKMNGDITKKGKKRKAPS